MTDIDAFRASLTGAAPPPNAKLAVRALWWAGKGKWDTAHGCVQQDEGNPECDVVHAYLHRVEGDLGNAGYWYRRAGRAVPGTSLPDEWAALVGELLAR